MKLNCKNLLSEIYSSLYESRDFSYGKWRYGVGERYKLSELIDEYRGVIINNGKSWPIEILK